ncbi:bacillithiol transferase BstA [Metabacillus sp. GX 13764]|uniref:YfiT family bacillithiol transferase n=1 Tax=Metabacillus kandeliae TaxID=2900151 RepID=UPI001E386E33|nr:bacillithiol transferase BstA [Metabacillus kandeliae]MCD7036027.1 bacillithiol transferase BstA [Metabacillus kandeliae]
MKNLQYPIGKFQKPEDCSQDKRAEWIQVLQAAPEKFKLAVKDLNAEQLDTPYRPSGWTIRQVIHHAADSHMNSFIRFKLALTEEEPIIKGYNEAMWAELPDTKALDPDWSLQLLKGLHQRWVFLLNGMTEEDFQRGFYHPEMETVIPLDVTLALYAWHSEHHLAHIVELRKRMNWT